jgi:hypothetical protein
VVDDEPINQEVLLKQLSPHAAITLARVKAVYPNKKMLDKDLAVAVGYVQPQLQRILFISYHAPYCEVHLQMGSTAPKLLRVSMSKLANYFEDSNLLRINSACLVNRTKIAGVMKVHQSSNFFFKAIQHHFQSVPVLYPRLNQSFPSSLEEKISQKSLLKSNQCERTLLIKRPYVATSQCTMCIEPWSKL